MREMDEMKKILLIMIFFILNTVSAFSAPSPWETLRWMSKTVKSSSRGSQEQKLWNGSTEISYKDDLTYDETNLYVGRSFQQKWESNTGPSLEEKLQAVYEIPIKSITSISISKDGKSLILGSDGKKIKHSGEYRIRRFEAGSWYSEKSDFEMALERVSLFTVENPKILKGLENSFLHLVKSSQDSGLSLDDYFINSTDYYSLGLEKFHEENYTAAVENFATALSLDQNVENSHYNLGRSYYELGEYEKAIGEFQNVLEISPDSQNTHYYLGLAYYANGDFPNAETELSRSVQIEPQDAQANYHLGILYYKLDKHRKAVTYFKKALELDKTLKKAYYYKGVSHYFLYQYQEALRDIKAYIKQEEDDPYAYYYKGLIHYISLQDNEALQAFSKALELNPEFSRAYYYRGYLYYDNGEIEAAKQDYEALFKLAPQNKLTKKLKNVILY